MRRIVAKGKLPGVAKQSLFADSLGHPQKPLRDMASYMYGLTFCSYNELMKSRWFGALYGIDP
jgi:hypothetical protein